MIISPERFWHENLGRFLHPGVKPGEDPVMAALSKSYKHAAKESILRLGSGKAASLIQDGSAVLMADIRLEHAVPDSVRLQPGTWRTVPNWMAEIITAPPEPPFMFIIYGKNPAIKDRLRLNATRDTIEICGAQTIRCRPAVVRAGLEAIGDMPASVWRKAVLWADLRDRDLRNVARSDEELDRIATKYPNILDVLDAIPERGTGDYEAMALVHSVRTKDAALRSADEIAGIAA